MSHRAFTAPASGRPHPRDEAAASRPAGGLAGRRRCRQAGTVVGLLGLVAWVAATGRGAMAETWPPSVTGTPAPPETQPAAGLEWTRRQTPTPQRLDELLSRELWREHSYGLALRPPLDAKLIRDAGDDALIRIVAMPGFDTRVYIKQSQTEEVTVEKLVDAAAWQVGLADRAARALAKVRTQAAGRPCGIVYFLIPERKGEPWVLAHAFVLLSPTHFVLFRMETQQNRLAAVQPVFEALVHGMSVADPVKLDEERKQLVERTEAWHKTIDARRLHAALIPEQWFRILRGGKDVGYLRITQERFRQLNEPGVRVAIQTRMQLPEGVTNSLAELFLSDDLGQEVWSIRTTQQAAPPARDGKTPGPGPRETSWAETGVRSVANVTVTLDGPTGPRQTQWRRPDRGYLSQAEVHLLGALLPRQASGEYGFYAYYPNTGKLSFRTERVEVAGDQSISVYSRPSQEQPEQYSRYDAHGRLLERRLEGDLRIVPASKTELATIWQLRP